MQEQFPNTGIPTPMRISDWENTLRIRAHAKSTRAACEADCFTFSASLRYTARITAGENNEVLSSAKETPCYVKFAWKIPSDSYGAFAERKLIGQDIEPLLARGLTPCLPFVMHEFKLPLDNGLAAWSLYNDILVKSKNNATKAGEAFGGPTQHVHLLAMEACGEITLADYLYSEATDADVLQIYLMLFHAIGVLSKAGISHNDLHLRNVVIKRVPATVVRFAGRTFVARAVPIIIDWDMGCSTRRHNRSLSDYNYVGIFNTHNPVFDLFGAVKTLIWNSEIRAANNFLQCVINQKRAKALVSVLRESFKEVVSRHPWLFAFEFCDRDGDSFASVQQTPYFDPSNQLKTVAAWPADIEGLAPSVDALQAKIHALIERFEGRVTLRAAYAFD
jgi:hypothetical protein